MKRSWVDLIFSFYFVPKAAGIDVDDVIYTQILTVLAGQCQGRRNTRLNQKCDNKMYILNKRTKLVHEFL